MAVPRFTYGAEVWYSPIYKPQGAQKSRGSVSVNNKLRTAQRKVATAITGGLRTTSGDVLDVHAYILPIDLLMNKLLYRAALHLCSLPKSHPLHAQTWWRSFHRAKHHLSPIHTLLHFAGLDPKKVETISPVRRSPSYKTPFSLTIPSLLEIYTPLHSIRFPYQIRTLSFLFWFYFFYEFLPLRIYHALCLELGTLFYCAWQQNSLSNLLEPPPG